METLNIQLAKVFKNACMQELEALKPGNVHIFADGHGMTVEDFILSADAAAQMIALPDLTLGQRILYSVQATYKAVACNTNLGIILLSAPLIEAALLKNEQSLTRKLKTVLANTSVADAQDVFDAIKLANPAGLGKSKLHDVYDKATCTLFDAMQTAAHRDLIAQQYTNDFADIVIVGLKAYENSFNRLNNAAWSTTALYITLLSTFTDSHIIKKNGESVARKVMSEAKTHLIAFNNLTNPKLYFGKLLAWDTQLKSAGINPGTTADMTVASLLMINIALITNDCLHCKNTIDGRIIN